MARSVAAVAELFHAGQRIRVVVVSASSALREIVRPGCGQAVADKAASFATAVRGLPAVPEPDRRAAARARAAEFGWPASVRGMLAALRVGPH